MRVEWATLDVGEGQPHVVAASSALEHAAVRRIAADSVPEPRQPSETAPALPDALPWNRLSPSEHAPAISLDAVVRASEDGADRGNHGDLITYVRLDWEGLSADRPTYRVLAQALEDLVPNLPRGNGTAHEPVDLPLERLDASMQATAIESFGFAKVAITAAMLLDTPVALVNTEPFSTPQLLKIIDAVTALLPYGYRAGLEVRAWTQATGQAATGYLLSYATSAHRDVRKLDWGQTYPMLPGCSLDARKYLRLLLGMKKQDKVAEGVESLAALTNPCGLDLPQLALHTLWRIDRWVLSPQRGAVTADSAQNPDKGTKLRWRWLAAITGLLKRGLLERPRIPTAPGNIESTPIKELDPSALAETIKEIGFAKVAITAAMLLDSPVALVSAEPLSAQQRLKIIDAVTALLPCGYRAGLKMGTSVQASRGFRASKALKAHLARDQRGGRAGGGQQPPQEALWLGYAVSAHRGVRDLDWDQEHPMLAGCSTAAREYLRLLLAMQRQHDVAEVIAYLSIQTMPHGSDLPRLALTLRRMDRPSLSSSDTLVDPAWIYQRVATHAYDGGTKMAIAAFSSLTADAQLDRTLEPLEKLLNGGEISRDDLALVERLGPRYVRLLVEIGCWSERGDVVLLPTWEWLAQAAPLAGSENAGWWATLVALRDSSKDSGWNRARLDILALMVSRRPLRPLPQTLSETNADEYLREFDAAFWDPPLDGRCRELVTTRLAESLKGEAWVRSDRVAVDVLMLLREAVTPPNGRGEFEFTIPDEVLDVVADGLEATPDLREHREWAWWWHELQRRRPRADPIEEAAAAFAEALKRRGFGLNEVGSILRSVASRRLRTADDVEWFLVHLRAVLAQTHVGIGSVDIDVIYYGVIDAILDNWLGTGLAASYRGHLEATAPRELDRWERRLDLVLEFLTEEERRELAGQVEALLQSQKRTGLRRWLHR